MHSVMVNIKDVLFEQYAHNNTNNNTNNNNIKFELS